MKLQLEDNLTQDLLANTDLVEKTGSANGSAEVTEMLRRGIKAAQTGNRAEARQFLVQATEAEPDNENAWLWLASISEYPEELLIFLSNVLKINPVNERALEWENSTKTLLSKTFVQRGITANKDAQSDFAKQCFLQAIVHDDKNEMAWLWLASISEVVEERKSHLQRVLKINPNNETAMESLRSVKREIVQRLLNKAQEAITRGETEIAEEMIADILSRAPETEDAWMLKVHMTDSFSKKIGCLEKVLRINPDNQEASSMLALLKSVMQKTEPHQVDEPGQSAAPVQEIVETEEECSEVLELGDVTETPAENIVEPQPEQELLPVMTAAAEEVIPEKPESAEDFTAEKYYEQDETAQYSTEDFTGEDSIAEVLAEAAEEYLAKRFQQTPEDSDYESDESPAVSFAEPADEFVAAEIVEEAAENPPVADEEVPVAEAAAESEVHNSNFSENIPAPSEPLENSPVQEDEVLVAEEEDEAEIAAVAETPVPQTTPKTATLVDCPFCNGVNEPQDFICNSCHAMLTLSDVEMLLAHTDVDQMMLEKAVERMELEKNLHKFGAEELRSLGIGHINLKNLRKGFEYLQEAVYMNPNDVLLGSQVNSLAIRLSEIEEQQNNHSPHPKNKTILVVDDSPTVRKLITGKLEKCGHEVICAVDGMEALEKINEEIPDLILLDITMPRMDGYQVCKLIRGNDATRDVPVVMISGKDGFFDKVRGRMAGTTGYITKPFGPETLMKTVETYIS